MNTDLPIYKITIDPEYSEGNELGIEQVAFTSKPAVKIKGMAFNSQQIFQFQDEPKMRIVAPAMIPMEIYRNDDGEEYFVEFTEQEIEQIFSKFMFNLNNQNLFNLEHDKSKEVPAYILEAWIVENPMEDKSLSSYGISVPKGTLMLTAQITDKEYYTKLVESGQVGFSIEGFLGMKLEDAKKQSQNKYNMMLPDGEHQIEDKIYIVKDGEVVEIKDVEMGEKVEMADEPATDAPVEEEVAMEEVVEEEKVEEEVEMAIDPAMDSEAITSIVMPLIDEKINEVLQVIADLKNSLEVEVEPTEEEVVETKLTAHAKFTAFRNAFLNK
jgi:hypothetical protein